MKVIRKNISLVLGISIPILMILMVAGSIYLPGLFIQPKVNFLYMSGYGNYCDYYNLDQYSVIKNKLTKIEIKPAPNVVNNIQPCGAPIFFIHDVVKNESMEVSFEEAQKLNLDSNIVSSDGFQVVNGSRGGSSFPFFFSSGSDYNSEYITGHNVSKKLNIKMNGPDYYYYNFRFFGWII
jgi:hypothetical protein